MLRITVVALLCLAAAIPAKAEDVWAPAKAGKLECLDPDFERKTCSEIAHLEWIGSNKVVARSRAYLEPVLPGVVVNSSWTAVIDGDKSCAVLESSYLDTMTFEVNGMTVSETDAARYRGSIAFSFEPLYGKNFCIDLSPIGKAYVVQLFIDSVPNPTATRYLAWIDPDAGFSLAP